MAHEEALTSDSSALGQTPAQAAGPPVYLFAT